MSPEQQILDLEALLKPISDDAPSGENVRNLAYDEVKALRTTESADSMVGTLRAGEFKTAQWDKVITVCVRELTTRTKDLQLGVWLAEAVTRVHGMPGLAAALEFLIGLNEKFWPSYYSGVAVAEGKTATEDGGLDMRAGRFAELDKLLRIAIENTKMTTKVDNETHAFWEWKQIQILYSNASRAKPEERDAIETEANAKKEVFDKAVGKSSWEFYDEIMQPLQKSMTLLGKLRETVDRLFNEDPGKYDMEDQVTGFSDLRKEMEAFHLRIEAILDEKPAPPGKGKNAIIVNGDEGGGDGTGTKGGGGGDMSVEPDSRAEALRRLSLIAQFFQRTEPHSPVSYLVNRAVKWGEMGLEGWLDEVIADPTILNALRETLGLPKKDGY
jgi:type VI secretion system protein ImpA